MRRGYGQQRSTFGSSSLPLWNISIISPSMNFASGKNGCRNQSGSYGGETSILNRSRRATAPERERRVS